MNIVSMDILRCVWIPLKPRKGFSENIPRHTMITISSPIRWELSLTEVSLYWNNLTSTDIKIWTTIQLPFLGGSPRMNDVPSTIQHGRTLQEVPVKIESKLLEKEGKLRVQQVVGSFILRTGSWHDNPVCTKHDSSGHFQTNITHHETCQTTSRLYVH